MERACGRDNSMYYLSEMSNLDEVKANEKDKSPVSNVKLKKTFSRYNVTQASPGRITIDNSFDSDARVL